MDRELKHSERVLSKIQILRSFKDPLFRIMKAMCAADSGKMFQLDVVMHLAAKRALSTTAAFSQLVELHNMVSARAMLRVQIDTGMRLYAFHLVDTPHELAKRMLDGEKISSIKDRDGNKLSDA